jgi:type IV secretory pathway VirB3-like protein
MARPPGWHAPIIQPLTHRSMYGGVPFMTFMILVFVSMQLLNFKLYKFLVIPPVLFVVLRLLYRHDEWMVGTWLEHVRDVIQKSTTLDV